MSIIETTALSVCRGGALPVADPEGVPWNPSFEGLLSKKRTISLSLGRA